jgi:hypothetical protein
MKWNQFGFMAVRIAIIVHSLFTAFYVFAASVSIEVGLLQRGSSDGHGVLRAITLFLDANWPLVGLILAAANLVVLCTLLSRASPASRKPLLIYAAASVLIILGMLCGTVTAVLAGWLGTLDRAVPDGVYDGVVVYRIVDSSLRYDEVHKALMYFMYCLLPVLLMLLGHRLRLSKQNRSVSDQAPPPASLAPTPG